MRGGIIESRSYPLASTSLCTPPPTLPGAIVGCLECQPARYQVGPIVSVKLVFINIKQLDCLDAPFISFLQGSSPSAETCCCPGQLLRNFLFACPHRTTQICFSILSFLVEVPILHRDRWMTRATISARQCLAANIFKPSLKLVVTRCERQESSLNCWSSR